jgi:histidinol phosphatase-like enzyme
MPLRWRFPSENRLRHLKNRLNVCTLRKPQICFSAPCGFQTIPMGNADSPPNIDVRASVYIGDRLSEVEFSSATEIQRRS